MRSPDRSHYLKSMHRHHAWRSKYNDDLHEGGPPAAAPEFRA